MSFIPTDVKLGLETFGGDVRMRCGLKSGSVYKCVCMCVCVCAIRCSENLVNKVQPGLYSGHLVLSSSSSKDL